MLLTKVKSSAMGIGARTMAFFRKGEELEATNFESLPYDDPTLVPPKLGFRDVDRVPRNYKPLVFTFLLVVVAAVSVFGWHSVREIPGNTARAASELLRK